MNTLKHVTQLFLILLMSTTGCISKHHSIKSPDNKIEVNVFTGETNKLCYTINYNNQEILLPSELGILRNDGVFYDNMEIISLSPISLKSENYQLNNGKQKNINYTYNEATVETTNADGKPMQIMFRVSNDGVAFRYTFKESNKLVKITEEKTTYHFPDNTNGFLQPVAKAKSGWCETNPSYEEFYNINIKAGTSSPTQSGWVYPALFKNNDNWIAITEANLDRNYCATRLTVLDSIKCTYKVSFPNPVEIMPGGELLPNSTTSIKSPWRVLSIGSLKTITESTLGTDLAEPAINMDFSFVKPGTASWSWIILKDDNIIYDVQKEYIDFAADMNWEYCLIDADWDRKIGYDKIQELVNYANYKNIGILLWYNSSGDWNTTTYSPKSLLLTSTQREKEFALLKEMGVKGIKVDFFGGDGQSVIAYYHDILQDAAKHGLMVNFHGATLPRGWHRTYPNLMTVEAVRGFENVTFRQEEADKQAVHCTMQPFTRNLFDPMDYTPVNLTGVPNIERRTSPAFELALPILFQSGIQHLAETPEGMSKVPDFVIDFLADCPTTWDETKLIEGFPGQYVVMARRAGDKWYIGGINADKEVKDIQLDLSFIGSNTINLITDNHKDKLLNLSTISLSDNSTIDISLKHNEGFVIYQ